MYVIKLNTRDLHDEEITFGTISFSRRKWTILKWTTASANGLWSLFCVVIAVTYSETAEKRWTAQSIQM